MGFTRRFGVIEVTIGLDIVLVLPSVLVVCSKSATHRHA